ncbi:hypothetical protein HNR12_003642 [Streptomonospora nanhaiensis]|uniref:Uncharacterized protein n=1 Tax=Streptomonospora nanhaiensis TaxID=1323731 RepID=A0A853BRK2_9ACTN|nr:hypothetical protein [Streptomonospora nanhaiensis]
MWSLRARSGFVSRLPHAFDARPGAAGGARPGRGPRATQPADGEARGEGSPAQVAQRHTHSTGPWR